MNTAMANSENDETFTDTTENVPLPNAEKYTYVLTPNLENEEDKSVQPSNKANNLSEDGVYAAKNIHLLSDPTSDKDGVTKEYADQHLTRLTKEIDMVNVLVTNQADKIKNVEFDMKDIDEKLTKKLTQDQSLLSSISNRVIQIEKNLSEKKDNRMFLDTLSSLEKNVQTIENTLHLLPHETIKILPNLVTDLQLMKLKQTRIGEMEDKLKQIDVLHENVLNLDKKVKENYEKIRQEITGRDETLQKLMSMEEKLRSITSDPKLRERDYEKYLELETKIGEIENNFERNSQEQGKFREQMKEITNDFKTIREDLGCRTKVMMEIAEIAQNSYEKAVAIKTTLEGISSRLRNLEVKL